MRTGRTSGASETLTLSLSLSLPPYPTTSLSVFLIPMATQDDPESFRKRFSGVAVDDVGEDTGVCDQSALSKDGENQTGQHDSSMAQYSHTGRLISRPERLTDALLVQAKTHEQIDRSLRGNQATARGVRLDRTVRSNANNGPLQAVAQPRLDFTSRVTIEDLERLRGTPEVFGMIQELNLRSLSLKTVCVCVCVCVCV